MHTLATQYSCDGVKFSKQVPCRLVMSSAVEQWLAMWCTVSVHPPSLRSPFLSLSAAHPASAGAYTKLMSIMYGFSEQPNIILFIISILTSFYTLQCPCDGGVVVPHSSSSVPPPVAVTD